MNYNPTLIQLCPIPIYINNIDLQNSDIDNFMSLKLSRIKENNGYVSENKRVLHLDIFKNIKNSVKFHVDYFTHYILKVNTHIRFELENSWVVMHKPNDYAHNHMHQNSILSGIFYLKVNANSGKIIFGKDVTWENIFPRSLDIQFDEYDTINCKEWGFTPEISTIIIFPSHLHHSVTPNMSDQDRYCVAFNVFPRGELGFGHEISELNL